MSQPFRDEAIPLVTLDGEKFTVNPEALALLKLIEAPISVIGVAGLYRTGKSYLLNRVLLNRARGFGVASSINACTKGLWIWGRPLKAQGENGEIVSLVVIDSEGLGALDQDSAHDCRVFALVLLLSSVFLYNSAGALDEGAIDGLSLVVSLTKHIRVRAQRQLPANPLGRENDSQFLISQAEIAPQKKEGELGEEPDDSEEFAEYFPAFLWVLRDFSLQLVDEDGDAISAREYLERALQPRPGLSDEVLRKNRVRRLLNSFFRERDCFTLVRPLTDEQGLQRLEELELEQLRPEFVGQALDLRRKITALARKKRLRGRDIGGEILGSLLESYVAAINGGAVPNIEGAWQHICRRQARGLVEACFSEFAEGARERAENGLPMAAKALAGLLKDLRAGAIEKFNREAMLSELEKAPFMEELRAKMKEVKASLKADNDHEFEALLSSALGAAYSEGLLPKILEERITEERDLASALGEIRRTFERAEPDGPKKMERLFRFLLAKSGEANAILWKNKLGRFAQQIAEKDREHKLRLQTIEGQLQSANGEWQILSGQTEELHKQLQEVEFEKSKLEQRLISAREDLLVLEQETERQRAEEKSYHKSKHEEMAKRLEDAERAFRNAEGVLSQQKSEAETQLALLEQKIEFLQKMDAEAKEQLAKAHSRLRKAEADASSRESALAQDFEHRLKAQAAELAKLRDLKNSYEEQLGLKANAHESMLRDFEDKEEGLKSFIAVHEKTILSLREQLKTREAQTAEKNEEERALAAQVALCEAELRDLGQQLRAREDRLQLADIALEKERALGRQQAEHFEIKLGDLAAEVEELRRLRESALQALESSPGVRGDPSKQLQEARAGFEERVRRLGEEAEAEREELLARLRAQAEESERGLLELRRARDLLLAEKLQLADDLAAEKSTILRLEERVKTLEQGRAAALLEAEAFFGERLRRLEGEADLGLAARDLELREARARLEEGLAGAQQAFEGERARLEKRLAEERLRAEALARGGLEELERRRAEEVQGLEEELEGLQLELQAQDLRFRAGLQKLEGEAALFKSKLEAAERQLADSKAVLEKDLLAERNKSLLLAQGLEQERRSLLERLELQKAELAARALEALQLRQTADSQAAAHQRQIASSEKCISELRSEIAELKARLEALVQEKYALREELAAAAALRAREAALQAQRAELLEKRAAELAAALERGQAEAEERLARLRAEQENLLARAVSGLREELALWESRYEEKKRAAKEIEAALSQKVADLERSRYILQEKLGQAEQRRDELEKRLQIEGGRAEGELRRLKENHGLERGALLGELEALRKEKYALEVALAEAAARFDKERAVLEGKAGFLEQQARKLRGELSESQANFDQMFQKFHQFRVADKEESESAHGSYVLALEQRYQAQILDLKEQIRALAEGQREKLRLAEREARRLEQANQELAASRQGSGQALERRVGELLEAERRLQDEVLRLRAELERIASGAQREFEAEREGLRRKVHEAEARAKRLETERHLLVLEQEKQKTKWLIEREQFMSGRAEALELVDRLQRQREALARESEKLKGDVKVLRKANLASNLMSMGKMNNRSELFSVEKSVISPREFRESNKTGNSSPRE